MPSFLSKVLRRPRGSDSSTSPKRGALLDGPFEDVSPTPSPSLAAFPAEASDARGRNADKPGLFRSKSRSRVRSPAPRAPEPAPHLSLSLGLGAQSEELEVDVARPLSDAALGATRLTPADALALLRACAAHMAARGLDALGVMTPHWHAASPALQRQLASLFALSAVPPPSAVMRDAFATELGYARRPHDSAALLRWGVRHLQLAPSAFGSAADWYATFAAAERGAGFPARAYSELLPAVPEAHRQLLEAALDLFEGLAAHAEDSGASGSRVAMALGLWLLCSDVERAGSEGQGWAELYGRWEASGRRLEHLFLARIRDAASRQPMPKRLTDLVRGYPFGATPTTAVLPRPRGATRTHAALLILIHTPYTTPSAPPAAHPYAILAAALAAFSPPALGAHLDPKETAQEERLRAAWDGLLKEARGAGGVPVLANVFSDATVRMLGLLPPAPRVFALTPFDAPTTPPSPLATSPSTTALISRTVSSATAATTTAPTSPVTPASPASPADWGAFTAAGFAAGPGSRLASTLFDTDVQRTAPPAQAPSPPSPTSRRNSRSGGGKLSFDLPRRRDSGQTEKPAEKVEETAEEEASTLAALSRVPLDEAFVDFVADYALDARVVPREWPGFVLAELRAPLEGGIGWVVVEQAFVRPAPPAQKEEAAAPPAEATAAKESAAKETKEKDSPAQKEKPSRPALATELSSRFSLSRRRFPFFSADKEKDAAKDAAAAKDKKERKGRRASRVPALGAGAGEMGEKEAPEAETEKEKERGGVGAGEKAALAVGVGAVAAAAAAAGAAAVVSEKDAEKSVEKEKDAEKEGEKVEEVVAEGAPVVDVPAERLAAEAAAPPAAVEAVKFDDEPEPAPEPAPVPTETTPEEATPAQAAPETAPADAMKNTESTPAPGAADSRFVEQIATPASTPAAESDAPVDVPADADGATLPAAPAPVVGAGETVGPALALATSEVAAQADAAAPEPEHEGEVAAEEPAAIEEPAVADEPAAATEEPVREATPVPSEVDATAPPADADEELIAPESASDAAAPEPEAAAEPVHEEAPEQIHEDAPAAADVAADAPAADEPDAGIAEMPAAIAAVQLEESAAETTNELPVNEAAGAEDEVEAAEPEVELPVTTSQLDAPAEEPPVEEAPVAEDEVDAVPEPQQESHIPIDKEEQDAAAAEPASVEPEAPTEAFEHVLAPAELAVESEAAPAEEPAAEPTAAQLEDDAVAEPEVAEATPDVAIALETVDAASVPSVPVEAEPAAGQAVAPAAEETSADVAQDEAPHVEHVQDAPADVVPDVEDVIPQSSTEHAIPPAANVEEAEAAEEERAPTPIPEDEVPHIEHVASDPELPLVQEEPTPSVLAQTEDAPNAAVQEGAVDESVPEPSAAVDDEDAVPEERVPTPIPEDEVPHIEHVASDPELPLVAEEPAPSAIVPPTNEDSEAAPEETADAPVAEAEDEVVPEPQQDAHVYVDEEEQGPAAAEPTTHAEPTPEAAARAPIVEDEDEAVPEPQHESHIHVDEEEQGPALDEPATQVPSKDAETAEADASASADPAQVEEAAPAEEHTLVEEPEQVLSEPATVEPAVAPSSDEPAHTENEAEPVETKEPAAVSAAESAARGVARPEQVESNDQEHAHDAAPSETA